MNAIQAPLSQQPIPDANPALQQMFDDLARRIDETRQELKSDIQSKVPSSRRFSWVLLFVMLQVLQGVIVVHFTVRAAASALDSAHIPEMTRRYSDALKTSQELVRTLNANVSTLNGLVGASATAWKDHVEGFVQDLPRLQTGYQHAVQSFTAEATTLPERIVERFFRADEVRASLAAYKTSVESAATAVQQKSDAGIDQAMKSYEARVSGPSAVTHFEQQIEARFEANKDKLAESVASGMKQAVASSGLQDKLGALWDGGLAPEGAGRPEGFLHRALRTQAEGAGLDKSLVHAMEVAAAPPLEKYFAEELGDDGGLAALLSRDVEKVPLLPALVQAAVDRQVAEALPSGPAAKVPPLRDTVREVVSGKIGLSLAALSKVKGPISLTCQ